MSDEDPTKYELLQNYRKFLHDCNNVLTGISGNAELASLYVHDPVQKERLLECISVIRSSSKNLAEKIVSEQDRLRPREDPNQLCFNFY